MAVSLNPYGVNPLVLGIFPISFGFCFVWEVLPFFLNSILLFQYDKSV